MMRLARRQQGFTLMELLIVMIIIGILSSILLPAVMKVKQRGNEAKCAATIDALKVALSMYQSDWGWYPPSYDASQRNGNSFNPAYNTTLVEALVTTKKNGPYMGFTGRDLLYESGTDNPVLVDAWGNAYIYVSRSTSATEGNIGPYHPYDDSVAEADLDRNTYNIYSLGRNQRTYNAADYSGAGEKTAPSGWDDNTMYDNTQDGDWVTTTNPNDGQYDDINSWDGRPAH